MEANVEAVTNSKYSGDGCLALNPKPKLETHAQVSKHYNTPHMPGYQGNSATVPDVELSIVRDLYYLLPVYTHTHTHLSIHPSPYIPHSTPYSTLNPDP